MDNFTSGLNENLIQQQSLLHDLYDKSPYRPQWHDGKLLSIRMLQRDALTNRAYFDAVDLTNSFKLVQKEKMRREAREALGVHFNLSVHAGMVKVKALDIGSPVSSGNGGGIRGSVVGFSRASRKRLIEFMASVRYDTQSLFATLTYPDEFPDNPDDWKANFEALRRRFERAFPFWRFIWRIEIKERLSGENAGTPAPHYHLIIVTDDGSAPELDVVNYYSYGKMHLKSVSPLSIMLESWLARAWFEIVGSGDEKHLQHGSFVVAVRNRRHAMKYVAKYIAKEDQDDYEIGRRWGRVGRFDKQASVSGTVTRNQYIELKRLIRKWQKSLGSDYHKRLAKSSPTRGITVFGLGDETIDGVSIQPSKTLIYKMLRHVEQITGEKVYWLDKYKE